MSVQEQWRVETEGRVDTAPTVVGGTVVVGCDEGFVYALDAETGDERWRVETEDQIPGSPAVVEETVVAGSEDGCLYAIDAESGDERWRYDFDTLMYDVPSPAVLDGVVYVGTTEYGTDHVCAIDVADGAERWRIELDGGVNAAPLVAADGGDRTLFLVVDPTMGDSSFVALDAGDGSERWRHTVERPLETAPTAAPRTPPSTEDGKAQGGGDGEGSVDDRTLTVFFPDRNRSETARAFDAMVDDDSEPVPPSVESELDTEPGGSVTGLDPATGEERVVIEAPGPPATVPTVADGTLYAGTAMGDVFAADVTTGRLLWSRKLLVERLVGISGAPTVVGDQVIATTADGVLAALDAEDGEVAWHTQARGIRMGTPTVVDGSVYFGDGNSVVAVNMLDCHGDSRGSRVRRATLGHHENTVHSLAKTPFDGTCGNCGNDLDAVDNPAYCWHCGWELEV